MNMTKVLLISSSIFWAYVSANQACDCFDTDRSEFLCYIGALDFKVKNTETEHLKLCYDGNIVRVDGGVYCFKEHPSVEKLYFLFVDPEAIRFEDNTIDHLTFISNAPYHCYKLVRSEEDTSEKPIRSWRIKREPMQKKQVNGTMRVIIPDHTLIIPLASSLFKKNERDSIVFAHQALAPSARIVKLPEPVIAELDHEQIKQALMHANLCIMNLKSIHRAQDAGVVNLDKHRLVQEA